jgi:hypothetical protein
MKLLLLILASTFAATTQASEVQATVAIAPTVSCNLMYSKRDDKGISVVFKRGNSVTISKEGASDSNGTFTLTGKLSQVCAVAAAGMGGLGEIPCADLYTLSIEIKNGNSSNFLAIDINSKNAGQRYSTALNVGNEQGFANCDVQ